jgi:predicted DNA-binding transcriptional regulator AlpA
MRTSGLNAPKFVKMGRVVRYRVSDLEEWIAARVVGSTSEVEARQ